MFKHLLVPLDGSVLAEVALPAAAQLAQKNSARVTLLHVIERNAPETVHGDRHLRTVAEAEAYLQETASRFFAPGTAMTHHVHSQDTEKIADAIAEHVLELNPDTVIMCKHGRYGLKQVLVGSLAQQVVSRGNIPLLLVQPPESGATGFTCSKILVPHDGLPAHEPAMPAAAELASLFNAEVRLIHVVPTQPQLPGPEGLTGHLLPTATRAVLDLACEEGKNHLLIHVQDMTTRGLKASSEVLRGDPAREIVKAGKKFSADLIVLATHGKLGTQAFWAGSTTSKVIATSPASMLMVPVKN
jgi:nucleotide-binding universal stress UspA family protein